MTRAVFLDALGTLVELEPPWPHLAAGLGLDPGDAERAFRAEMRFYREHALEGADEASLADLRRRCAALLSSELGRDVPVEAMMAAIRFRAYPDAAPALAELGARGLRLVCVSNWDVSLEAVLDSCGLAALLDGIVTSAAVGAAKPDAAIFEAAVALAGCEPAEALHVGDTPGEDVSGATACGIPSLLLDRTGRCGDISSIGEIVQHLRP